MVDALTCSVALHDLPSILIVWVNNMLSWPQLRKQSAHQDQVKPPTPSQEHWLQSYHGSVFCSTLLAATWQRLGNGTIIRDSFYPSPSSPRPGGAFGLGSVPLATTPLCFLSRRKCECGCGLRIIDHYQSWQLTLQPNASIEARGPCVEAIWKNG